MPASLHEQPHKSYMLSSDKGRLDLDLIHRYLSETAYWATGRTRVTVERSIEHSYLVMGAYDDGEQVGFARMVTDLSTWAWLCDVFVLPEHQGNGLGTALVGAIVEHPDVIDISRQFLATADAHGLYAKFGFNALEDPTRWMSRSSAEM